MKSTSLKIEDYAEASMLEAGLSLLLIKQREYQVLFPNGAGADRVSEEIKVIQGLQAKLEAIRSKVSELPFRKGESA